jgi:uncharacterized protein DUF5990
VTVHLRIVGMDLPGPTCGPSSDQPEGYREIEVGVQRGKEVVGVVPADAKRATWDLDLEVRNGRLSGPYVQGRGDQRFIYLSWGERKDGEHLMFRRAKLMLEHLDPEVVDGHTVEARLGLTDGKGNPRCAAVRPPDITWTVT